MDLPSAHANTVRPLLLLVAGVTAFLLVSAASCADSEPEPTAVPPPTSVPLPGVVNSFVSIRDDNPLIAEVTVTLDQAARVYVEYENEAAGRFRTMTTESVATAHVVPVLRLRPASAYTFEVFAVDGEGRVSAGGGGEFTTGELPEILASLDFDVRGSPTSELVLFDASQRPPGSYIIIVDRDSNIVWYYANPPVNDQQVPVLAIRQKSNFNLVFQVGFPTGITPGGVGFNCCIKEITPLGELVDQLVNNEVDKWAHHDIVLLPDDEILYLADEIVVIDDTANGGDPETRILVESLRILDQSNHTTRELWNSLDQLSTDVRVIWEGDLKRWLHANSVSIGPRGNYILSLKNRNQVISISPDGKSVEWKLGGPNSDYRFPDPADRFYGQHTATELPDGNILVFDNGTGRPDEEGGEFSRALVLALSDYDLTAIKAWEYRADPDIFSRIRSSAYRLDNGNTLISFDVAQAGPVTARRTIVEVPQDGTEVWKLEVDSPAFRGGYRAYPIETIMGETRLK